MNNKPHPSHDLEWRDSSHYEFVCKKCNTADTPSGWGKLVEPCMEDEKVKEALKDTPQKKLKRMAWHFNEVGIYTKANYSIEIAEYIDELESKLREK